MDNTKKEVYSADLLKSAAKSHTFTKPLPAGLYYAYFKTDDGNVGFTRVWVPLK